MDLGSSSDSGSDSEGDRNGRGTGGDTDARGAWREDTPGSGVQTPFGVDRVLVSLTSGSDSDSGSDADVDVGVTVVSSAAVEAAARGDARDSDASEQQQQQRRRQPRRGPSDRHTRLLQALHDSSSSSSSVDAAAPSHDSSTATGPDLAADGSTQPGGSCGDRAGDDSGSDAGSVQVLSPYEAGAERVGASTCGAVLPRGVEGGALHMRRATLGRASVAHDCTARSCTCADATHGRAHHVPAPLCTARVLLDAQGGAMSTPRQRLPRGRGQLLFILAVKTSSNSAAPKIDLPLFELDDPDAVVSAFAEKHSA